MKDSKVADRDVVQIALRHVVADTVSLTHPRPKPTSRTGQFEADLTVWRSGATTSTGVWECDPGEFTAVRADFAEICQILSGSATVTGVDGVSADVGPGSLLVLPQGWAGIWVVRERIRKTYVLIGAAVTDEPSGIGVI